MACSSGLPLLPVLRRKRYLPANVLAGVRGLLQSEVRCPSVQLLTPQLPVCPFTLTPPPPSVATAQWLAGTCATLLATVLLTLVLRRFLSPRAPPSTPAGRPVRRRPPIPRGVLPAAARLSLPTPCPAERVAPRAGLPAAAAAPAQRLVRRPDGGRGLRRGCLPGPQRLLAGRRAAALPARVLGLEGQAQLVGHAGGRQGPAGARVWSSWAVPALAAHLEPAAHMHACTHNPPHTTTNTPFRPRLRPRPRPGHSGPPWCWARCWRPTLRCSSCPSPTPTP